MAKPETGALTARESAGKDSRGIRRRLGVFLRADAVRLARVLRERRGLLLVLVPGVVAGLLMLISEFLLTHYITVGGASCTTAAPANVRDSCAVDGFSGHHGAILIVGLFTIVMAVGATLGRSRPAAIAMLAAGVVCLGIALIADLPDTNSTGSISPLYSQAAAHAGAGFWLELIGALLAIGAGAMALAWPDALVTAPAPGVAGEEDAEDEVDVAEPPEAGEAEAEAEAEPVTEVAPKEPEPEPAEAEAVEAEMVEDAPPKGKRRGRRRGARDRKREPGKEPADVGVDEGSEGEAVEPETKVATRVEDAPTEVATSDEAAVEETVEDVAADEPQAEAAADDEDTWDVEVHDTPAARRSAERRAQRRERADAARKRQKRQPRERDRKNRPKPKDD